jgi:AcrR family transcriptional regulator
VRAQKTKTEVRQEQITRSALALISKRGLKNLNVAGVARVVGVVPSALYRHYRSKDAMLDAVLDLVSRRLHENVQAVRDETLDPLERLRRLLMRHVRFVRKEVPLPRVVFSEEVFHGPRQRRQRVYRLFGEYLENVARLIREGQRGGRIRTDLRSDTLAVMFLGLVQPAAILWLMSDGKFNVTRHAQEAWKVYSAMIAAPLNLVVPRRRTLAALRPA